MKRLMAWTLSAISCAQIPDYVPTDGLVAWWNFEGNLCSEIGDYCFEGFGDFGFQPADSNHLAIDLTDGGYLELPSKPDFNLVEFTIVMRGISSHRIDFWKGNPQYPDDVNYSMRIGACQFVA